jgi:hypothetical protein
MMTPPSNLLLLSTLALNDEKLVAQNKNETAFIQDLRLTGKKRKRGSIANYYFRER